MENSMLIYVDIDDTLCDYAGAKARVTRDEPWLAYPQSRPGFFRQLEPLPEAIKTVLWLQDLPGKEVYILSSPSVYNPHSYTDKRLWVEDHFGFAWVRRLIISPEKGLLKGDYLIDDNTEGCGQEQFEGRLLHFGSASYPHWPSIRAFFANGQRP